ncbi:MAG: hypothetical protein KDD10_06270 [Phaeodactylibacter sp.]|nr:hypothetical protein [Phaeodactylibacter sp.]MCB9297423.1 hypothetical protein [Lewinellaceae bacterium]
MMYCSPDIPFHLSPEGRGRREDLQLLVEGRWLMNTEVRYWIQERRSRWHLTMVYIAVENPFKLICRRIDAYHSGQKALTFAKILQRGIRKDARGTLKTDRDAFNICAN